MATDFCGSGSGDCTALTPTIRPTSGVLRVGHNFARFLTFRRENQPFPVALVGEGMPTAKSARSRSPRRRGQTLTEFALVVPVLFLLIMGVLDGALLMFSVGTARYAAAEGSRMAAQLGNVSTPDSQVITAIRNTVSGTQLFSVGEIDIYRLNQDGQGNLSQNQRYINRY